VPFSTGATADFGCPLLPGVATLEPQQFEHHADLPELAQHSTHSQITVMTTPSNQRIYLDDLARRWRQDTDLIVELASSGILPLWISFTNVYVQKIEKRTTRAAKKKKPSLRERREQIEVRPMPELLSQILGRCDRMLITAELPGVDNDGKAVAITNTVGDEWGETSMIGLKPTTLFARLEDVQHFEKKNNIVPATVQVEHQENPPIASTDTTFRCSDHSGMPPELKTAIACWQALFVQKETTAVRKADILAWLQQHHPDLTKASTERIALVVSPAKGGCR
jgi:hypothetical protein